MFATGIAGSVWLVSACADRESKDTGGEVIAAGGGDDGSESCDGTPPVVESIDCENTGIQDHFETGEPTVTMALAVELSDDYARQARTVSRRRVVEAGFRLAEVLSEGVR